MRENTNTPDSNSNGAWDNQQTKKRLGNDQANGNSQANVGDSNNNQGTDNNAREDISYSSLESEQESDNNSSESNNRIPNDLAILQPTSKMTKTWGAPQKIKGAMAIRK